VVDIRLDASLPEPPFEQVRSQLARAAATGTLETGTKLPTVRALAADLGIAVNTVARAYKELEADGVVVTEGRRGTFVAAPDPSADVEAAAAAWAATARRAGLTLPQAQRLVASTWDSGRPTER
jgi:DNA-binding transcriptional regulator YhcF (GntR family)